MQPIAASPARELFLAALEREDNHDRTVFLDQACGGDTPLRRVVEELLAARDAGPASPLDQAMARLVPTRATTPATAVASLNDTSRAAASLTAGGLRHRTIGRYKLLEEIGEGGMGLVFMAQQTQPVKRKVALKLIKPGLDSREVIARFEAERQALALMDHPNIAHVLDAGTAEDGRPYFVMELVRGVPITEYCDDQSLSITDRLHLFHDVCTAVQHAHTKGVIHRDLKPSNILVTLHDGVPVVKVIDFGVAKALNQELTERTLFTRHAQLIGTPLYMSPEQAELSGLDVDTRSDVYSLGVLLYELLTGTTPFDRETFDRAGFDGMRRIIREEQPARPSAKISTLAAAGLSTVAGRRKTDPRQLSLSMRRELDWIVLKALEKDRNRRYESASALARDVKRYLDDDAVEACPPSVVYRLRKLIARNRTLAVSMIVVVATLAIGLAGLSWGLREATRRASEARVAAMRDREQTRIATAAKAKAQQATLRARNEAAQAAASQAAAKQSIKTMVEQAKHNPAYKTFEGRELRRQLLQNFVELYTELIQINPGDAEAHYTRGFISLLIAGDTDRVRSDLERAIQLDAKHVDAYAGLAEARRMSGELDEAQALLEQAGEIAPQRSDLQARLAQVLFERGLEAEGTVHLARALKDQGCADAHRLMSERHLANGRFQQAVAAAETAVRAAPQDMLAHGTLSQAYRAAGRYADALAACDEAERVDGGLMAGLSAGLRRGRGKVLFDLGRHDEAFAEFDAALTLYPDGWALMDLERLLQKAPRWRDRILQLLRRPVDLEPHERRFWHRTRGLIFRRLGLEGEAIADLSQAITCPPEERSLYRWRGETFFRLGRYHEALTDFERAMDLPDPDLHTITYVSAAQMPPRGDPSFCDGMLRLIDKADELDGKRRDSLRMSWLIPSGRIAEALAIVERASVKSPPDVTVLTWTPPWLVASCPETGLRDAVFRLLNAAVQYGEAPGNAAVYRGQLHAELMNLKAACTDFEQAMSLGKTGYYTHYQHALTNLVAGDTAAYRADCHEMLRRFSDSTPSDASCMAAWTAALAPEAVNDYKPPIKLARRVCDERPADRSALTTLGGLLLRAGRHEEAREQLEAATAAKVTPASSEAYATYLLAIAHHHLGEANTAREWLAKANRQAVEALGSGERISFNRRLTLELFKKEAVELILAPVEAPRGADASPPRHTSGRRE